MVTGSTPRASNQRQDKNSEKSRPKARDEMPPVCSSTNEITGDNVSCYLYMAIQISEAGHQSVFDIWSLAFIATFVH